MYQTSTETAEAILSYSRTWRIRLEEVGGDIVIMGDEITKAESEHSATTSSDDIELGAVCAAGWTITTSRQGEYVGKEFRLYLYLIDLSAEPPTSSELIPMGEFTCVKAPRCGDGRELHLYDKLYFTDKPYTPAINLPAQASAVEQDICNQLGCVNGTSDVGGYLWVIASRSHRVPGFYEESGGGFIYTSPFDFEIPALPENGATMREMLGYIAAIHGQFGCIDRQGQYVRRWYAPESQATIDSDHADEPTVSETANHIVGIRCNTGGRELTAGRMTGGRVLEIENPYMTQVYMRVLLTTVQNMTWYTAQVSERLGDPRHDIGDTVTIESNGSNYDIPITMIQYSFDGGLLANISAAGLTEEEQTI